MTVNKLIAAFVTLILGVALLGVVATSTEASTSKTYARNESFTIDKSVADINTTYMYTVAQPPTSWKIDDCPLTSVVLTNSSDNTAWTVTTDYTFNLNNGTFYLLNSTAVRLSANNLTYVSYNYCADDYINIGWGRTTINLVGGFFALAILFVSLALFYSIGKDVGIV